MSHPHAFAKAAPRRAHIEVTRVGEDHAEPLADFFRAVWSPDVQAADVLADRAVAAAANPVERGADIPAFAFLSDGKVLGYIGTLPTRLWNGTAEHPAHWFKGFMVRPEFRGGPVGHAVLKEAVRQLDLTAVMTVALPSRRLFTSLGFRDHGAIANYVTLVRPGRVLRALDLEALGFSAVTPLARRTLDLAQRSGLPAVAGVFGGAALGLWRATVGRSGGVATVEEMPSPSELDDLWKSVRPGLAAGAVRDSTYIRWRYGASQGDRYAVIAARTGGRLAGIAAVRRPREKGDSRLRGIRVATLSDVLFPKARRNVALALLAAAERTARDMDADAMLCTASHPSVTSALRRRAYVKLPGNIHFLVRDSNDAHAMPGSLADWWVTRGDANSDEVF
jgi:GNAT superfamily N-acetyltransferase